MPQPISVSKPVSKPRSKLRLLLVGLGALAIFVAGSLIGVRIPRVGAAEPATPATKTGGTVAAQNTVEQSKPANGSHREVHVNAHGTRVEVDRDHGKVRVAAPYTVVRVDPDNGRVRVRAPYVNLEIDW
ncbi:MAG TPA: hypothetical protein VFZ16_07845 [Hyphomicrobiaceae bacterium]|nr:hypothetical protein [Hyphomicrobiaceae bacterium]